MKAAASNPPTSVPKVAVSGTRPVVPPGGKLLPPRGGSGTAAPGTGTVRFSCGHDKPVSQLVLKRCPRCVEDDRQRESKAAQAKRQGRPPVRERLPAGCVKTLTWDGAAWRGTLAVPGVPGPFWFEARTEVGCCRGLHRVYRAWLAANPHPPESAPVSGAAGAPG